MIDTHCHLTEPRLSSQLPAVLIRASAVEVKRVITIATDLIDSVECVQACDGRGNVRCAVGVHPTYVEGASLENLPRLRELQKNPAVLAIGETGLDYHHGTATKAKQFAFFEWQLALASEVDKPMVVHCREAINDCLAVLRNFPAVRAVFHCFTGTAAEAEAVLAAGYLLGFTGVVTFKNCGELATVVRNVPADRFFVETDAPWLSPEPMRGTKVNEPALVVHTARRVAALRGTTLAEIESITDRNAAAFFGWPLG